MFRGRRPGAGAETNAVLFFFAPTLCAQGETSEIGHQGNYSVAEAPP